MRVQEYSKDENSPMSHHSQMKKTFVNDLRLKMFYAFNKAKWGLLAFLIILAVAIVSGVLFRCGLLQQALLYMTTLCLFLIKFTFKMKAGP